MITTSYYKLKGDTLIRRDQSEIRVNFRLMNKDTNGQWTDGNSIGERYVIAGDAGAHEISEADARLMAGRFGGTIDDPEVRTGIPWLDEAVKRIVTGRGKIAAEIEREKNLPRVYPPNDGIVYDPRWE